MANRRNEFSRPIDRANELNRLWMAAYVIGSKAPGHNNTVKVAWLRLIVRDVSFHWIPEFTGVRLAGNSANSNYLCSGFAESKQRIPYFEFLIHVVDQ